MNDPDGAIRVLVADDHPLVRSGLLSLLASAPDIEVVGSAADGPQAVEIALRERPDVVLMDLSMPGGGIEATRSIHEREAGIKVVVLTSFSERQRILEAVDAGALGYLLKDAGPDELLRAVRAAARGEAPFAPRAALVLINERTAPTAGSSLTAREREILELVAEGLPNKVIARRLEISEKTVKAHLTSAYQTIGVTDRTQAALWVRERSGWRGPAATNPVS